MWDASHPTTRCSLPAWSGRLSRSEDTFHIPKQPHNEATLYRYDNERRPVYRIEAVRAGREWGRVEYLSPRKPTLPVRRAENQSFEGTRGFRSGKAYELAIRRDMDICSRIVSDVNISIRFCSKRS